MLCMWVGFQRIHRKKSIGKLTGILKVILRDMGGKSKIREAQERLLICQRLREKGKINNSGLSTLEMGIAKSFPVS